MRVLVLEDNFEKMINIMLRRREVFENSECLYTPQVSDALAYCGRGPVDVAFVDGELIGERTGVDFLEEIHSTWVKQAVLTTFNPGLLTDMVGVCVRREIPYDVFKVF